MRRLSLLLVGLVIAHLSMGQTRVYLALGSSSLTYLDTKPAYLGLQNNSISTSGQFTQSKLGVYNRVEVNIERRVFGSIYFLSGLAYFNSGYTHGGSKQFYYSQLKNSYASVPLLFRYNFYNSNVFYLDLGIACNYLLKANLQERFYQDTAHGNIAQYVSRFSAGYAFQFSIAIKRFVITAYQYGKAPATAKDFSNDWGLPRNQSSFLLYVNRYTIKNSGIKISYRIR